LFSYAQINVSVSMFEMDMSLIDQYAFTLTSIRMHMYANVFIT